jgi:hypothetical protein
MQTATQATELSTHLARAAANRHEVVGACHAQRSSLGDVSFRHVSCVLEAVRARVARLAVRTADNAEGATSNARCDKMNESRHESTQPYTCLPASVRVALSAHSAARRVRATRAGDTVQRHSNAALAAKVLVAISTRAEVGIECIYHDIGTRTNAASLQLAKTARPGERDGQRQ